MLQHSSVSTSSGDTRHAGLAILQLHSVYQGKSIF
jgi:hypothetical protein